MHLAVGIARAPLQNYRLVLDRARVTLLASEYTEFHNECVI